MKNLGLGLFFVAVSFVQPSYAKTSAPRLLAALPAAETPLTPMEIARIERLDGDPTERFSENDAWAAHYAHARLGIPANHRGSLAVTAAYLIGRLLYWEPRRVAGKPPERYAGKITQVYGRGWRNREYWLTVVHPVRKDAAGAPLVTRLAIREDSRIRLMDNPERIAKNAVLSAAEAAALQSVEFADFDLKDPANTLEKSNRYNRQTQDALAQKGWIRAMRVYGFERADQVTAYLKGKLVAGKEVLGVGTMDDIGNPNAKLRYRDESYKAKIVDCLTHRNNGADFTVLATLLHSDGKKTFEYLPIRYLMVLPGKTVPPEILPTASDAARIASFKLGGKTLFTDPLDEALLDAQFAEFEQTLKAAFGPGKLYRSETLQDAQVSKLRGKPVVTMAVTWRKVPQGTERKIQAQAGTVLRMLRLVNTSVKYDKDWNELPNPVSTSFDAVLLGPDGYLESALFTSDFQDATRLVKQRAYLFVGE